MNEAEARAEHIDPALKAAGWGAVDRSRIHREVIAPGHLQGKGQRAKAESANCLVIDHNTRLTAVDERKKSLPHQDFTDTIRDAVAPGHRLGFVYTSARM